MAFSVAKLNFHTLGMLSFDSFLCFSLLKMIYFVKYYTFEPFDGACSVTVKCKKIKKKKKLVFKWPRGSRLPCWFGCKEVDLVFVRERGGWVLSRLRMRVKALLRFFKKKRKKAQLVTISGKGAGGGGVGRIRGVSFLSMPPSVAHRLLPPLCQRVSEWSRCGSGSVG